MNSIIGSKHLLLLLFFIFPVSLFSQDHSRFKIPAAEFSGTYDISSLLITDSVFGNNGYFGSDKSNIQIVFISVRKNPDNPREYFVQGASRHMKQVTPFRGSLTIKDVYQYPGNYNVYRENPDLIEASVHPGEEMRIYTIVEGDFLLKEDSLQRYSGVFSGTLKLKAHQLRDGKLVNDLREWESINYSNAEFKGSWVPHKGGRSTPVRWMDGVISSENVPSNWWK